MRFARGEPVLACVWLLAACAVARRSRRIATRISVMSIPPVGRLGPRSRSPSAASPCKARAHVRISGSDIQVAEVKFDRPLTNSEVNVIQDKAEQAREKLTQQGKTVDWRTGAAAVRAGSFNYSRTWMSPRKTCASCRTIRSGRTTPNGSSTRNWSSP